MTEMPKRALTFTIPIPDENGRREFRVDNVPIVKFNSFRKEGRNAG